MNETVLLADLYLDEVISSFMKMKKQGDRTMAQLDDQQFYAVLDPESNSIEVLIRHMNGNMLSRWTDFLTTDGEKPNRARDEEFEAKRLGREELKKLWEQGWDTLFLALRSLTPDHLLQQVYIRGEAHTVMQAIQRQIAHYSYHVGQIVFLGKHLKSTDWQTLSIARGQSKAYKPGE
jgi:hypothetical protein